MVDKIKLIEIEYRKPPLPYSQSLGKILRDAADHIDIWVTKHTNLRPKQRAIELKQDHLPNKKLQSEINKLLGVPDDR